jgi:hypothetical protein
MSLTSLRKELEDILTNAGFDPEQYYIKMNEGYVSVHFDLKEAVEYFKGDFDNSDIAKDCIFEYRKEGKTHAACVYLW